MFGLIKRQDGEALQNLSSLRRTMPFIMPGRNESAFYWEQTLDVTNILAFLQEKNADGAANKLGFFHILMAALVRAVAKRPHLNRFVSGGKLYRRKEIAISFAVKKQMADDANMTAMKVVFEPTDTLAQVVQRMSDAISAGRNKKLTTSEKEMALVGMLPGFLVRALVWLQRALDSVNLLPAAMTKNDPLYATMFVANLGSVGVDAPFHHLYEYGTVPIFAAIGKIHKAPVVDKNGQIVARDVVKIRYTIDERIEDGFYFARSFDLFEEMLQNPHLLEQVDGTPQESSARVRNIDTQVDAAFSRADGLST